MFGQKPKMGVPASKGTQKGNTRPSKQALPSVPKKGVPAAPKGLGSPGWQYTASGSKAQVLKKSAPPMGGKPPQGGGAGNTGDWGKAGRTKAPAANGQPSNGGRTSNGGAQGATMSHDMFHKLGQPKGGKY